MTPDSSVKDWDMQKTHESCEINQAYFIIYSFWN